MAKTRRLSREYLCLRAADYVKRTYGSKGFAKDLAQEMCAFILSRERLPKLKISKMKQEQEMYMQKFMEIGISNSYRDHRAIDPYEFCLIKNKQILINKILSTISLQENIVISLRFGLFGLYYTQREIGYGLGLTTDKVRRIEFRALLRLRHPDRSNIVREFAE